MNFVMIYGPPGVGKLTVARSLARLTGFVLFDNHMSIDWGLSLFDFAPGPFWNLVNALRTTVAIQAAREDVDLIATDAFKLDVDTGIIEERCLSVEAMGGRVCLVQLTCTIETLESRIESEGRLERGKIVSATKLRQELARHDLLSAVPDRVSLCIDNTERSGAEVAAIIVRHFDFKAVEQR